MGTYVEQVVQGANAGDTIFQVDSAAEVIIRFGGSATRDVVIATGVADTDISWIGLRDANGVQHKVYVAAGALTITTGAL